MASLRHRRGIGAAKGYDDYIIHDDGSGTTAPDTDTATDPEEEEEEEEEDGEEEEEEEEEEEDRRRLHLGIDSMTAKGIQHLCSELLEIKKASEQDFSANVYLSYLSFIRMFQEAGDLDKDVHHLKRQVMAHRRLVQHLNTNCLYSSSSASLVLPSSGGSKADEDDMDGFGILPDQGERDEELELEVLLSEHRMDEALQLLERQGQALQTMHMQQQEASGADADAIAMAFASSVRALSARKARVAARFASLAENPRTPRPELLKALSGLCRLGDAERANHLLFERHRASVDRGVEELRALQAHQNSGGGAGGGNYIRDLARVVFSSIVRTSRSFVTLHGHPSAYTPRVVRWAREEMEDLSAAFSEYVRSMASPATAAHTLALALEAAECAVSYSPLLRAVDVVASERDVVGLVVPCVRDAVSMYGRHLREVVRLLVASDAWVLGRFLMPPGVVQGGVAGAPQAEYCLLTTNGRKFVTLIQEVVEDVAWPLHNLGIGTNDSEGLQLVAELFREYMHSIVELIPRKEAAAALQLHDEANGGGGDEGYTWQLAVLINCTTLVSLFPTMASGVFRAPPSSSSPGFPESAQREVVDSLISLIKEAAGQVWSCFCQQFIRDTMSSSSAQPPPPQGMPSMAFQAVFLRVRRLNEVYGTILSGEGGTMRKLLRELMEAMISWLSDNLDSWAVHGAAQVQLDVHFLLEFAELGGFCSESIRSGAMDLLVKAQETVADGEQDASDEEGCGAGGGWAADAAKHAVQVLLGMGDGGVAAVDAGEESDEMERRNSSDDEVPEESDEMARRNGSNDDEDAGQEETPEDEDEDEDEEEEEEDETGAINKSSDEFVSLEDEDDGVTMTLPAALSSPEIQKPEYSGMGDGGQERTDIRSGHHPELEQAEDGGDGNVVVRVGDETKDEEGMCHDAIQQQVEEQSSSSLDWEDIIDGGGGAGGTGSSRTRRRPSTAPVMTAGKVKDAPSRSRKKREPVSRSSKPRWHV